MFGLFKKKDKVKTKFSPTEFQDKLAEAENAQLIDVRTPSEFNSGYLDNSVNIDYNASNFQEELGKLNREEPLFLYCRSGNRSGRAAKLALEMGFKEILDLDGGILLWAQEDKPIQK